MESILICVGAEVTSSAQISRPASRRYLKLVFLTLFSYVLIVSLGNDLQKISHKGMMGRTGCEDSSLFILGKEIHSRKLNIRAPCPCAILRTKHLKFDFYILPYITADRSAHKFRKKERTGKYMRCHEYVGPQQHQQLISDFLLS